MKKIFFGIFIYASTLISSEINIAVSSNVSYAIDELIEKFTENNPNIRVKTVLGSSGKLYAQIVNGAPYGLFMSANMKYPDSLYRKKIATIKPTIYAEGTLAYLSIKPNGFPLDIDALVRKNITRIAIANPKTAPYGKASIEAMRNGKVYEAIKHKLVFAESISQTVLYAMTAANIGLVAKSLLFSPKMRHYKKNIHWATLEPSLYTPIKQGVVILKNGLNDPGYNLFYNFILSEKAKKVFKKYGYITNN